MKVWARNKWDKTRNLSNRLETKKIKSKIYYKTKGKANQNFDQ